MELTVYERITLLQVLPVMHKTSSFIKLKTLNKLADELGFDERELTDWCIEEEEQRITWDQDEAEEKEMAFGSVAIELVVDALQWLDREERLDMRLLGLCEKFEYEGDDDE